MRNITEYIPELKGASPVSFSGIRIVDLGDLLDENGNEILELDAVTSAVNHLQIANAATSGRPQLTATGDDANIGIDIDGKGSGTIRLGNESTGNIVAARLIASSLGHLDSSPTAGIGYGVGAGGTVTQATNKSTGVTLDKVVGTIVMNGAALAADVTVAFTLTNSAIAANDVVVVVHDLTGTIGAYSFGVTPAGGSALISVHNNTPASLSEAIQLRFAVIKGVVT